MIEIKKEDLKRFFGSLATLAGLAYATGYLVLRARARALGIDPSLGLVEEVYVFAGFRFLLALLIAIVVTLPIVAAVRAGASWLTRILPARGIATFRWAALVILAAVVVLEFRVLGVSNALLVHTRDLHPHAGLLLDGVIGRNAVGVWLVLGTTGLAVLSLWWAIGSGAPMAVNGFTGTLMLLLLIQVLLLPVYQGVFFADRSVRVFDGIPKNAIGLVAPVGIVDRGGDYVTVLGNNASGETRLVMIDKSDLKGAAIKNVTTLCVFLEALSKPPAGETTMPPCS